MKILAVGDIVGENGLDKLKQVLPKLKEEAKIDFIVVNAENVAGGMGITFENWNEYGRPNAYNKRTHEYYRR